METQAALQVTNEFLAFVLTVPNMLSMGFAIGAIRLTQQMWPKLFARADVARFLPLASTALCMVGVWIQDKHHDQGVGDVVLLGFVLGAFSGKLHKIFKQTVLGHDDRIVKRPKRPKLK